MEVSEIIETCLVSDLFVCYLSKSPLVDKESLQNIEKSDYQFIQWLRFYA